MDFVDSINQNSEWILELESMSDAGVPMLDIFISHSLNGRSAVPAWRPYRKPTAVGVPLHHSSAHPPTVHKSWPISEVSRVYKLSSTAEQFLLAKKELLSRWRAFYMRPEILASADAWKPSRAIRRDGATNKVIRLVLDFHPAVFFSCIQAVVDRNVALFRNEIDSSYVWPEFQIAWKGSLKPLWLVLRRNHL